MREQELISIIRGHRANSLGVQDGDLSNERAKALDHYHGRPYGNEVTGRSQVVSRDVAEAVDWAMPGIMRAFVGSGVLAEFDPVGPEDEALAGQESEAVNRVMMQENPGFMVVHDAVKDTLILKNGYTKQRWQEEVKVETESYSGLTLDQANLMLSQIEGYGDEVEVLEADSEIKQSPMGPIEEWATKLRIRRKCGRAVWEAVPAEEIRVSKQCRGSLQDSPFVEHVTRKTRSELIEMGMPRNFVDQLAAVNEEQNDSEVLARDSVDDESDSTDGASINDRSMDLIEYCEAYVLVDYDGDGVAERRMIVTVNDRIPPGAEWNEEIPCVPIAGWVAKRMPHRHIGESLDDELADFQEIMTVLKRQILDNIYLTNNSEVVVNEDHGNLRDFMTRTPGGIKRVRGQGVAVQGVVMPLQVPTIVGQVLPVLEYFRQGKQQRSGIDGPNTGVDPDVLQNTTKGAFVENLMKASQKLEMIIRTLAETGVKESVMQMHALMIRHQNIAKQVQIRGRWVPVNPQEWRERTNLTVKVGLGTGSEEDKRQKLSILVGLQGQLMQMLGAMPPQAYAKVYAMFDDVAKTLGHENPEKYAISPGSPDYQAIMAQRQQPQPDPRIALETAKLQQQGQLEQQRMMMQTQVDNNRQEQEARQQAVKMQQEQQLEQFRAMLEAQAEREKAARDIEFQRWKAELEAAVKIQVANMGATRTVDPATVAATGEIAAEVTQTPPIQ